MCWSDHTQGTLNLGTVPAPLITYRRGFQFDLAPNDLWDRIEEVDQFERWCPWLTELRSDGKGLHAGTILHGAVTPPLPYRMQLKVKISASERPHTIEATIEGDLTGHARLCLSPENGGTWAEVAWTVEMRQPAMRLASRIARPLLQWGHDRVVAATVSGFRRRIATRASDQLL